MSAAVASRGTMWDQLSVFWKWVVGVVSTLLGLSFLSTLTYLVKRSYERLEAGVSTSSDGALKAMEKLAKDTKESLDALQSTMHREFDSVRTDIREVARESKNTAQQVVAVSERLGASAEKINSVEERLQEEIRRLEDKFEDYRKEVHDRINEVFSKGVEMGRVATERKRNRTLVTPAPSSEDESSES